MPGTGIEHGPTLCKSGAVEFYAEESTILNS